MMWNATRSLLSGPAMAWVPLLMLPAVIGAGWIAIRPDAATEGRVAVLLGLVAVAWYVLGGVVALQRIRRGMAARRMLRTLRPALATERDPVWAVDGDGHVMWLNPAAEACNGDDRGTRFETAMRRLIADPGAIADMRRRAGRSGTAALRLPGALLELEAMSHGRLQVWRHRRDTADVDSASAPAPERVTAEDVIQRLPVALLHIGHGGEIISANPAAVELLGSVPAGSSLGTLLDGPGRPVRDWLDDVLSTGAEARPEVLRRRADGPERYLQVALRRDWGDGLLAVLSDASELKTLEAQFVQSQKMQAIGQLAGGIAHDFNNLLTAITGHVDLLMLRHDKQDPDYADLDQIGQNANRAASLVGQLLAFSRKQTLKPSLIDLRDTLADLTHLLNRLVGERVRLSVEHDADLCPIRADRRQLEQVVMNLVVNARDAMPQGGGIFIRTQNMTIGKTQTRDRVSLPKGRYVCVTVRDEGVGIPADRLDKIFEPFFTTKRTGEGTGLGLATVYGIVKQSGGYVFCDSTQGVGTTFSLYFPARTKAELEAAVAAAAVAAEDLAQSGRAQAARVRARVTLSPGVVLLVEDEAPVRAFASRALRLKGIEVLEADSAEAALQLLAQTPRAIDVFVTDVVMPGMDGPSWVRSALRERPDTRVVFISGYTDYKFEENDAIAGAQFLQKPFSLNALTETVTTQIEARQAGSPVVQARPEVVGA